ncbi:MAG TPA: tRNA pseudouridine(38-40) synthase TruA [Chthoniobacteraceae bacterium]|nr:tRNA pseudouridine(38-40) synthase TruA [Chthoniobacteraceae bacterium]
MKTESNALERLKLIVAYDGTPFKGWQSQAGGNTVQDHIEAAFAKICGKPVSIHGSGRTDAGVHALGQCAHADVPRGTLPAGKWVAALNANLPREIRILKCVRAPRDFHARYSAKGKVYTYRILNSAVMPPFELNRAWHFPGVLDLAVLEAAAKKLTGTHDFAGFAANRGTPVESTVRTLHAIEIRRSRGAITIVFEGNGFLYKMARLLTGSMVRCAQHRAPLEWIDHLLLARDGMKTSFAAPADGLCLTRVLY